MFSDEFGELLCCGRGGRGALEKRLSSELVSVEEGRVEVEPCWPLLYGREELNWVPLLDLLSLIKGLVWAELTAWTILLTALRILENLLQTTALDPCHLRRSR
jgi:hypothetical protein